MRLIGSLNTAEHARRLSDFLLTQGIAGKIEADGEEWVVWIKDEDHVEQAKTALFEFLSDPDHARYLDARGPAETLRKEAQQRVLRSRENLIEVRRKWQRPTTQLSPLVSVVLVACLVVFWGTNFGQKWNSPMGRALLFRAPPKVIVSSPEDMSAWSAIRAGQVWRLFTPALLHGSVSHIVFNLMWWVILGGQVERRQGANGLLMLVLFVAAVSNVAQAVAVGPGFGGLSGVVYGLLGYIWFLQSYRPDFNYAISSQTFVFLIVFLFLGFSGAVENITGTRVANWAHAGGLLAGVAAGSFVSFLPPNYRRSRRA
ncbi:MAG: rhomboid family intramembrane serine protease [Planctomycetota bacterium]|nr:rhomboid family intramembrane serine protease [Planctomycetota bacterium]MDA1177516.1 rhomboid family intramembrane serine protease [Planctomycetota bacterium]